MTKNQMKNAVLEDVEIMFKNFSGREGKFNREGDRNFCVVLPDDTAEAMAKEGWNIKSLDPKDEHDTPLHYLPVAVRFGQYPPQIVMITSRGKTHLNEADVNLLDLSMIAKADVIVRPYEWSVSGNTGVKAYVKSLYVTIEENELELKYLNVPDSASAAMCTPGVDCPEDLE